MTLSLLARIIPRAPLNARGTLSDAPLDSDPAPDLASDDYQLFLEFKQFRALRAYEQQKEARALIASGKQLTFDDPEPSPPRSASNEPSPLTLTKGKPTHTPLDPSPYFPPPRPQPLPPHLGVLTDRGPPHSELPTSRSTWQSPLFPPSKTFQTLTSLNYPATLGSIKEIPILRIIFPTFVLPWNFTGSLNPLGAALFL